MVDLRKHLVERWIRLAENRPACGKTSRISVEERIISLVARYGHAGHLIRRMHILALISELIAGNRREGESWQLLDVGCGWGDYMFALGKKFSNITVSGIDINPGMYNLFIARAKSLSYVGSLRFILGSVTELSVEEEYDIVYTVDTLEHIEDDTTALATIHRGLRAGGWLVLHVPSTPRENIFHITSKWDSAKDRGHAREGYQPLALCDKLRHTGFKILRCERTFAKYIGGLAWEINALLINSYATVPLAVCLIPLYWLLGLIDVWKRGSSKNGRGILIVARKDNSNSAQ